MDITAKEIEESLLSSLLNFPDGFQVVRDAGLNVEDFADPFCKKIFIRMMQYGEISGEMILNSFPDDTVKICDLMAKGLSSTNIPKWCEILKEYTARRKVCMDCQKLIESANNRTKPFLPDVVERVASILTQQTRMEVKRNKSMEDAFAEYLSCRNPEKAAENVIPYGLPVDRKIQHRRGEIFTLGAAPGTGKTTFALSAMLNMAMSGKKTVLFCQEMPTNTLIARLVANLAHIPVNYVLNGRQYQYYTSAEDTLHELFRKKRILLRGNGEYQHSVSGISAELQRFYNDAGGIDWICIDYIQTIRGNGRERDPRERIDNALEGIKELSGQCNCACLLLSQLSRNGQQFQNKIDLTSLKESAHIEEASSIVAFLQRKENNIEFKIAKNRSGQFNIIVPLLFEPEYAKFSAHTYSENDTKP